jgi:hypothetical protein
MQAAAQFLAARYPFLAELLTKRFALLAAAGLVLATNAAMYAHLLATAKGYVTVYGPVIGGDFVVFDAAATAATSGESKEIYDAESLAAHLRSAFPERSDFALSWQYPPTMLLLVWPLGFAPYLASFFAWALVTGALFTVALRTISPHRLTLFLALASPAAFQTFITGQTGFLTAGLLALAAWHADRRWLVAGLAAGILTVKPQLGLLVPIAFAAAGGWRAFAVAAATAVGLALVSVLTFGAETWTAFIDAIAAHGERMRSAIFPFHKLVSVYGGATMIGAPKAFAMLVQAAGSLTLAALVALVWRRVEDRGLRLALLCAAAPLATPYAFYYEIAIFIPALIVVAQQGLATGWLKGERAALVLLWIAPMLLPGPKEIPGLPLSFLFAALTLALVLRRALAAAGLRPFPLRIFR